MPKQSIQSGSTSILDEIFIQDNSKTTGVGLTGLTSASSGLVCYRFRADDGNAGGTAISLTSTGTLGTWASGWFKEKDATNLPGVYQIGYTNASLASGSRYAGFEFQGATNMAPVLVQVELTGWNNQDAVRGGMTALPNANAAASGGLPTVDASNNVHGLQTRTVSDASVIGTSTYAGADTSGTTTLLSKIGSPAGASVSADIAAINAKTTNLPASPASTTNITGGTMTTTTNLTNAPTAGGLTATMKNDVTTAATAATPAVTVSDKTGFSLADGSIKTSTFGTCDFTATQKASITTAVAGQKMDLVDAPNPTAVVAIQSGLATATNLATAAASAATAATESSAAATNTASLPAMIESDQFTSDALANAPTGSGGGGFDSTDRTNLGTILNNTNESQTVENSIRNTVSGFGIRLNPRFSVTVESISGTTVVVSGDLSDAAGLLAIFSPTGGANFSRRIDSASYDSDSDDTTLVVSSSAQAAADSSPPATLYIFQDIVVPTDGSGNLVLPNPAPSGYGGGGGGSAGDGDTAVTQDTGGTDNLRAVDTNSGDGISKATVNAYLTSEYTANATTATIRAQILTGDDGRWIQPMMLTGGLDYTITFSASGHQTKTVAITA